eukprot:1436756-Prymnesium_polylepis.1
MAGRCSLAALHLCETRARGRGSNALGQNATSDAAGPGCRPTNERRGSVGDTARGDGRIAHDA